MILLYIFFSILVLGGKITFFFWLLYEKIKGSNSITLLLMAFFALLSIEHGIILTVLLDHIGLLDKIIGEFNFILAILNAVGIFNSIFLVFAMVTIIFVVTEISKDRSAVENVD